MAGPVASAATIRSFLAQSSAGSMPLAESAASPAELSAAAPAAALAALVLAPATESCRSVCACVKFLHAMLYTRVL